MLPAGGRTVKPVVDSIFPLADAAAAHARLDSGDARSERSCSSSTRNESGHPARRGAVGIPHGQLAVARLGTAVARPGLTARAKQRAGPRQRLRAEMTRRTAHASAAPAQQSACCSSGSIAGTSLVRVAATGVLAAALLHPVRGLVGEGR